MHDDLRKQVLDANLALVQHGLVVLTWGNVSAIDRKQGVVAIKPSGVPYETMTWQDMVVVDLDGRLVDGKFRPSSDLPTHLALYVAWPGIGGVTHTHAPYSTMFAQACQPIPCLGTTHADQFHGPVPVTRVLTEREVVDDYEANTGEVIIERFSDLEPLHVPAVLVGTHGPFTWGTTAQEAVHNAVALEQVARMALGTLQINSRVQPIPAHILAKHFSRKHGPKAYYGQSPRAG